MQYRSYVIIFRHPNLWKEGSGSPAASCKQWCATCVKYRRRDVGWKKIVVKWNHESILNTFRKHGKGKTAKVLLFEFIGRRWRRNIRFIRPNQLQNNARGAVDDVHGGAVDTDCAYSDTCGDDYLDDNDVNSDDEGRDYHVLDDNDVPIEQNEAKWRFSKENWWFQTKWIYLSKKLG